MAIRKKQEQEQDVYEAAKARMRRAYDEFDTVVVSFSGGKDSTAVLNIAIEVAEEKGKLPVKAVFIDEEAIHPTTIEYVERVRVNPKVDLVWLCLPVKHRNACSTEQPFWECWAPEDKDIWVRDMPECAIKEHPLFKRGESFQEFFAKMYDAKTYGQTAVLTGIRTQESIRRYQVIASKKNDSWIAKDNLMKNVSRCHPIYDWSSEDVWVLVKEKNLDYNKTYDIFNKTKLFNRLLTQRVCPPFGEEPLRGLWVYAECFPEMWEKMINRVKGAATAWRYANTDLYLGNSKPSNFTWQEYTEQILLSYNEKERNIIKKNIVSIIENHRKATHDKIAEETPHPITGACWKDICKITIKGDFKGRTAGQLNHKKNANKKKLSNE